MTTIDIIDGCHGRSSRFPRKGEGYINSTYYDKYNNSLDIGYQKLKRLNIISYPEFSSINKLFIDYNCLSILPDPKFLPLLNELTCSTNRLKNIPFYPDLTFLNISHNQITNCDQYHNSKLSYFDCSYNEGFIFNFILPKCRQLYINNNKLNNINLYLVPNATVIDCSNNNLDMILGGEKVIEIDVQHNNIVNIPCWGKLERLIANNNRIQILQTYPNLVSAIISYNKLIKISAQPSMKKIIANNNEIIEIGYMPHLELVDLSNNRISSFNLPKNVEYASLQFNPLTDLVLSKDLLKNIKELQVNFETYKYIYQNYYNCFHSVNVTTNKDKLKQILERISSVYDEKIISDIYNGFKCIKFRGREISIYKITRYIYQYYFSSNNYPKHEELMASKQFQDMLDDFTKFYYKTIVISICFNDYLLELIEKNPQ